MSLIEVKNVGFSYDNKSKAVNDMSFSVEKGEYVAIIGHNGSGKSTLAKLLNGLLVPTEGDISVNGFSVLDKKSLYEIRKRVGFVFQNPDNQTVASIVEDDIAFGPENLGIKREEIAERIEFALKSVGMQNFRKATPSRLSGGQKQRVAIAGVLALRPEVIVLDEATAMLDPEGRKEVLSVIKKLNEEDSVTVIAITHYMEEVINADKVFVVNNGEIVMSGTPERIFSQGEKLKNYGLEVPLACYIAQKLKERGLNIPENLLTESELGEALCKL